MIKVKHFADALESDDGIRIWVEPFGLTLDLCELCAVDHVASQLGPPRAIWDWFETHPWDYEYFRGRYHEYLSTSMLRPVFQRLADSASLQNITLLHQGSDPEHNTGVALYEFLSELSAYSPPDMQ